EQELLLKIDEAPSAPCVQCQSNALEKCVTAPSFRLKGGGYYATDEIPKSKQRNIASSANEGESKAAAPSCQKPACNHSSH
ncbi:MAG TPA: hypothetical protein PLD88_10560, partial [Candidatus Berkiella sp.]|nr:hypothetical protein [Candidatus Berkiella sp.]